MNSSTASSGPLITQQVMGIVLLATYALLFLVVPFFAIYKGWVYIIGCFFFGLGLRWQIVKILERGHIDVGLHYWDPRHDKGARFQWLGRSITIKNDNRCSSLIVTSMIAAAIIVVPIVVFVMGHQAIVLSGQVEANSQELVDLIRGAVAASNERIGTNIDLDENDGLKAIYEQVAGGAVNDFRGFMTGALKTLAESIGTFLGDWFKVMIATFIIGTFVSPASYDKAVAMHRRIITLGIQDEGVRNTVLRGGELVQEMIGQFMVGYLEVALRLMTLFFVIIYLLLPSSLGFLAAAGIAIFLGLVTAIPKIGGIVGMVLGFVLMALNLQTGFGWFGYELLSTNSAWLDTFVRMVMLGAVAKVLGLFEAYKFTPEIVGKKIGLDKIQIVFIVVMYAIGSFYWMIWGMLGLCFLAAMIRLTEEVHAYWSTENASNAAA